MFTVLKSIKRVIEKSYLSINTFFIVLETNFRFKRIQEDISELTTKYKLNLYPESLVICNGPSFNKLVEKNFEFVKNKNIFCVNAFVNTKYYEIIKPQFCVFMDSDFWRNDFRTNLEAELIPAIVNNIKNKTTWNIVLLLPLYAKKWNWFINLPSENRFVKIAYFNPLILSPSFPQKLSFKFWEKNKAIVNFNNVGTASIFLSLNLGCKKLFLTGIDLTEIHDAYVWADNKVYIKNRHFYESKEKDYHMPISMHELFLSNANKSKAFEDLEAYATYRGTKIYNLSEESLIDAFERLVL